MNVAELSLCKELYALSGWEPNNWFAGGDAQDTVAVSSVVIQQQFKSGLLEPAYDLGYLLRKLPSFIYSEAYEQKAWLWLRKNIKDWNAWYWVHDPKYGEGEVVSEHGKSAETPEDAACKLAIELFKQGVLK